MSEAPSGTAGEQLRIFVEKGVGLLGLNRPEKHNAISYEMWQGIAQAMVRFDSDDDVRVIVLYGEGDKAFSTGADISQFEDKRGSGDAVERYNEAVRDAYHSVTHVGKPTIAKISGYCIGGGMGTAMCCDLRIASDDSQFGIPAARLGVGYGYDSLKPLVELVGPSFAKEILFTGRRFSADEAAAMGFVNRVVKVDELDGCVRDYTDTIRRNAPLTVRAAKRIVAEIAKDPSSQDRDLCQRLVDECFASSDYKEGRKAFMEKRKPEFLGE